MADNILRGKPTSRVVVDENPETNKRLVDYLMHVLQGMQIPNLDYSTMPKSKNIEDRTNQPLLLGDLFNVLTADYPAPSPARPPYNTLQKQAGAEDLDRLLMVFDGKSDLTRR